MSKMMSKHFNAVLRHLQSNNRIKITVSTQSLLTTPECSPLPLRYTLRNPMLSHQQRTFYEDNGYIVIPKLIDDELIDECSARFIDICEGTIPKGELTVMKDISLLKKGARGQNLYYKIEKIHRDEVFIKYIRNKKLLDYVECFTGPNIMAVHSMLINKPPDSGKLTSRHPPHQDLHAFPIRPADRLVTLWTALEEVTLDNGCLYVLPGSHRQETLYKHDYPKWENGVNLLYYTVEGFKDHPRVMLPMNKGDTVFFHPLLIHGSGVNVTKGFRKSITCFYAASECNFIDIKGTRNEKFINEWIDVMKKIGEAGQKDSYLDFWKNSKVSLMRGKRINM